MTMRHDELSEATKLRGTFDAVGAPPYFYVIHRQWA